MIAMTFANENEIFKVLELNENHKLSKRLLDLGLYPNSIIRIVKNDISGPIILEVKGSKLVLGRKQAEKIMVEGV